MNLQWEALEAVIDAALTGREIQAFVLNAAPSTREILMTAGDTLIVLDYHYATLGGAIQDITSAHAIQIINGNIVLRVI